MLTARFYTPVTVTNPITARFNIGAGLRTAVSVTTPSNAAGLYVYRRSTGAPSDSLLRHIETNLNAAAVTDLGFSPGFKFRQADVTPYPQGGMLARVLLLEATTPGTLVSFTLGGAQLLTLLGFPTDSFNSTGTKMSFLLAHAGAWFVPGFHLLDYRMVPRAVRNVSVSQNRTVSVVTRRKGGFRTLRFQAVQGGFVFLERLKDTKIKPAWLSVFDTQLAFENLWNEFAKGSLIKCCFGLDDNELDVDPAGSVDHCRCTQAGSIEDMSSMLASRETDVGGDTWDISFELEVVTSVQGYV